MTDLADKIEANANLVLWCVHALGPDELYAAPSHAEAVDRAALLNMQIHDQLEKSGQDNTILCFFFADVWPYSVDDHAHALDEWNEGQQ